MKYLRFGGVGIGLLLAMMTQGVLSQESSPGVNATPVKLMTYAGKSHLPQFAGQIEAGESALLAFRVAGQIQTLHVKMGDSVGAGQVLAELDATDYRLNLEARQAEFDLAQVRANRAQTLFQRQLVSEDQFDTTQAELAAAKAKLESAREQLSFCKLEAPFDGSIAFSYHRAFEVVPAHQTVINLQDTSSLDVNFNLPDQWQHLLADESSLKFRVTFDLLPGVAVDAQLKEVNLQPDSDTNSHQVTLNLTPPANFSGRSGMSAQVQLEHPSLIGGRWLLPEDAIISRIENSAEVWRFNEVSTSLERVTVSVSAGGEVESGLLPGDRIVVAGVDDLKDGQVVRPWVREGGL